MKVVIISGRSGSGKSTALNVLEDEGYYSIDNLPVSLLPSLVETLSNSGSNEHQRVAICIDARNASRDLKRFQELLDTLPATVEREIIYLDADVQTLIKRFSETRRRHPLSIEHTTLAEAIEKERRLLEPIASAASLSVDTTNMNVHQLRATIKERLVGKRSPGLSLLFQSFGFKRGVPVDADMVFDLRALPNPHWHPDLRPHTGRDAPVREFLDGQEEVEEMYGDIRAFLDKWLPRFEANNRSYVTVAFGCTGGQHRSVYMAERLAKHFSSQYKDIQIRHRELPGLLSSI